MSVFAQRLEYAMSLRDVKQVDLVRATGIGKSSISTYLAGEYVPKQKNIYKIAKALDVNEAWLMGIEDASMERPTEQGAPLAGERLEAVNRLVTLTPEEFARVDAYMQGIVASRQEE